MVAVGPQPEDNRSYDVQMDFTSEYKALLAEMVLVSLIAHQEGVNGDQRPLVAVTLRQNDAPGRDFPDEVPTLTTFPVIPRRPGQ